MADKSPKKPATKTEEVGPTEAAPVPASAVVEATPAAESTEAAEAAEPNVPVTADAKSAFAAALERKKQAGQARAAHLDGHGGVGGATSSHKATRTFRRKSGSA